MTDRDSFVTAYRPDLVPLGAPLESLLDDTGFEPWHTGGGCMAFGRTVGEAYYLVTDGDADIDAHPLATVWIAGFYSDADSDGVYIAENVTLETALRTTT